MEDTRKFPIQANETLVAVVCSARIKRQYLRESSFFGKDMPISEVLDELADDEIVTVLRVDTTTWKSEDITEYCARQYLYDRDGSGLGVELDDEDSFPAYVRNSITWSNWKDDLESQLPVVPSKAYSSFRVRGASIDMEGANV
jgi:hypothetical protein